MRRREEGRRTVYRGRAARRRRALGLVLLIAAAAAVVAMLKAGEGGGETVVYDRAAAARYADRWALKTNPAFWASPDADCANFVSQCLAAGGLRELSEPGVKWHPNGTAFPSLSWCNCGRQRSELSRGTSTHSSYIASASVVRPREWTSGDIVFLGDRVDGRVVWQHVIICVGKQAGEWVYDSHTTPHRRRPVSTWYPEHFPLICYCHIADVVTYR